jgi:hypothetical protein
MSTDDAGNPFIATYWRGVNSNFPQYHILYANGKTWRSSSLNFRVTPFSLSGAGSKRIPIARPQVMVSGTAEKSSVLLVFRDEERGSKVSVATISKIKKAKWKVADLTATSVGSWEPTFDSELWNKKRVLNLFIQKVDQVDAEGVADTPPEIVQVLEWKPKF